MGMRRGCPNEAKAVQAKRRGGRLMAEKAEKWGLRVAGKAPGHPLGRKK